jgi:hypothetical protein
VRRRLSAEFRCASQADLGKSKWPISSEMEYGMNHGFGNAAADFVSRKSELLTLSTRYKHPPSESERKRYIRPIVNNRKEVIQCLIVYRRGRRHS